MFHSSSILRSFPLRAETTVDLSGSSMLPFPNVPCSLTPPQSPVTIASCGDLLLPSSQYDAVGLRGRCRPAGYYHHEAQSLHLRYGPLVARAYA